MWEVCVCDDCNLIFKHDDFNHMLIIGQNIILIYILKDLFNFKKKNSRLINKKIK